MKISLRLTWAVITVATVLAIVLTGCSNAAETDYDESQAIGNVTYMVSSEWKGGKVQASNYVAESRYSMPEGSLIAQCIEVDGYQVTDERWAEVSDKLYRDLDEVTPSDRFGEKGFEYSDATEDKRIRGVTFALANGIYTFGYVSTDVEVSDEDVNKWWNGFLDNVEA